MKKSDEVSQNGRRVGEDILNPGYEHPFGLPSSCRVVSFHRFVRFIFVWKVCATLYLVVYCTYTYSIAVPT